MNSKSLPRVSVVLCTFNRANLAGAAIESVLAQTYRDWELIVVNDGSADNTDAVVRKYSERDERIRLINQSNSGLSRSRNNGIRDAKGIYFAFIDDDDEYAPTHIGARVDYMLRYPEADIIWGGLVVRGPEEKQYVPDMERPGHKIHLSECFVSGTLFGKISVFNSLGGFRELEYAEDFDFMKRAGEKYAVRRVEFPTYLYSTESPNRMSDLYAEGSEDAIRSYRRGKPRTG